METAPATCPCSLSVEREELSKFMRPLTENPAHQERELDRNDPYATFTALSRPRPEARLAESLALKPNDAFARTWIDASKNLVCEASAWGGTKGEGRHAADIGGRRLRWRTELLLEVLKNRQQSLALLVKAQKYLEDRKEGDRFETSAFLAIVSETGKVRVIRHIPKVVRSCIAKVHEHSRYSFWRRLEALRNRQP